MNPVETILLENIDRPEALFIFPADMAAALRLRNKIMKAAHWLE
jgi:hypothetical protein